MAPHQGAEMNSRMSEEVKLTTPKPGGGHSRAGAAAAAAWVVTAAGAEAGAARLYLMSPGRFCASDLGRGRARQASRRPAASRRRCWGTIVGLGCTRRRRLGGWRRGLGFY